MLANCLTNCVIHRIHWSWSEVIALVSAAWLPAEDCMSTHPWVSAILWYASNNFIIPLNSSYFFFHFNALYQKSFNCFVLSSEPWLIDNPILHSLQFISFLCLPCQYFHSLLDCFYLLAEHIAEALFSLFAYAFCYCLLFSECQNILPIVYDLQY